MSRRPTYPSSRIPAWLVFLLAVALVLGVYYLWLGIQDFVASGGVSVAEATERAAVINTATAERIATVANAVQPGGGGSIAGIGTPRPSQTPVPECSDFRVTAASAIVREAPSTTSPVVTTFDSGEIVCVIGREESGEWYRIDTNPTTRRLEIAYMSETIIEAVNPTLTPSRTFTPAPTVTDAPTLTPSPSPTVTITPTRDETITNTPTPTPDSDGNVSASQRVKWSKPSPAAAARPRAAAPFAGMPAARH